MLGKAQQHANAGKPFQSNWTEKLYSLKRKDNGGSTERKKKNSPEFLLWTKLRLKTLTSNLSVRMSGLFWELGPLLLTRFVLAAFFPSCFFAPLLFGESAVVEEEP